MTRVVLRGGSEDCYHAQAQRLGGRGGRVAHECVMLQCAGARTLECHHLQVRHPPVGPQNLGQYARDTWPENAEGKVISVRRGARLGARLQQELQSGHITHRVHAGIAVNMRGDATPRARPISRRSGMDGDTEARSGADTLERFAASTREKKFCSFISGIGPVVTKGGGEECGLLSLSHWVFGFCILYFGLRGPLWRRPTCRFVRTIMYRPVA